MLQQELNSLEAATMPAKKTGESQTKRVVFYIRFSSWHQEPKTHGKDS